MSANIIDRRRINGPQRSVEPIYPKQPTSTSSAGRPDGRAQNAVRPIFVKTGPLSPQASSAACPSGSAYYEQGKIRISCAIYGPRQGRKSNTRMGAFDCDFKYAPFSCSWKRSHMRTSDEKEIALMLEQAISPAFVWRRTRRPASTLLSRDGKAATISAAINCISAALVDAGIELYDSVAACSVALSGSQWIYDCTQEEEDKAECSLMMARMPSADEVTYLLQHGKTSPAQTEQAIQASAGVCTQVYAVICHYLQASLEQ
ncbi:ribosomal protein S5 domain 2-type protein [Kickxella alabastrina]|uniref:ribosomal protein S5 domain 2-type protein n=1 Tax=Kickxella alabastrina TaxID=61397 RepID=UPI00221E4E83|nr:ribosomal protein S5 domain 2-type protein [Kickxella alabastrina]KAI7826448.1 ribosomal protein S5 domain 2-type protein [Kickxella alabastrina]